MSSQYVVPSATNFDLPPHFRIGDDLCPSCEQPIPPEKLAEIKGKIASKERERVLEITTDLERRHQLERTQAEQAAEQRLNETLLAAENVRKEQAAEWQKALDEAAAAKKTAEEGNAGLRADLAEAQRNTAEAIESAKAEAKREADAIAAEKLAEAQSARTEAEAALQAKLTEAERVAEEAKASKKQAIDAAVAEKLAEAQSARTEAEAALQAKLTEAERVAEEAKASKKQAVDAAVAEKLAEAQSARTEAEAVLQAKLAEAEQAAEEARASKKQAVDAAVAEKLAEAQSARTEAEAALQAKLTLAESQKTLAEETLLTSQEAIAAANAKATEAESQLSLLKTEHESTLAKRLADEREILEKAKEEAVNAERARTFEENQRLSSKVAELTRDLEKKTNEELGEGAEVDLFEALKEEFPGDNIKRVKKGEPGADIVHVVILQGRECGTIVYDSKNHKQYRTDHVAKLRVDQLAHDADHAILSTHKFPQGTRQLHTIDGILLANPARVVQLAILLRRHLLQVHTLRLSNVERESKTEALYGFITSEKCTLLFGSIEGRTEELMTLQNKEITWHKNNWSKQGEKLRAIQKAKADLDNEISLIVGTSIADESEEMEEAS
jgi:hypothetical protein